MAAANALRSAFTSTAPVETRSGWNAGDGEVATCR